MYNTTLAGIFMFCSCCSRTCSQVCACVLNFWDRRQNSALPPKVPLFGTDGPDCSISLLLFSFCFTPILKIRVWTLERKLHIKLQTWKWQVNSLFKVTLRRNYPLCDVQIEEPPTWKMTHLTNYLEAGQNNWLKSNNLPLKCQIFWLTQKAAFKQIVMIAQFNLNFSFLFKVTLTRKSNQNCFLMEPSRPGTCAESNLCTVRIQGDSPIKMS